MARHNAEESEECLKLNHNMLTLKLRILDAESENVMERGCSPKWVKGGVVLKFSALHLSLRCTD